MLTLEKVLVIGNSRLLFGYKSGSPSYSDHLSIMETEMTTFVEANLGGIHEKFVLLVSGCLGCRPFAFILKRDVVLMLRSLLFQGACALNPSDDEYSKAAKTHSSNSSLSLGKNEPMCKFKYGGSSIIPPMTFILVYIK